MGEIKKKCMVVNMYNVILPTFKLLNFKQKGSLYFKLAAFFSPNILKVYTFQEFYEYVLFLFWVTARSYYSKHFLVTGTACE